MVDRGRPADVTRKVFIQLPQKFGIIAIALPGFIQLMQRFHQRFSDEATAVTAEMAGGVGELAVIHFFIGHGFHSRRHLAGMPA